MKSLILPLSMLYICLLSETTLGIPTPDRLRELFGGDSSDESSEDKWNPSTVLRRIRGMAEVFADDAHRIYKKSFQGYSMDELRALLDQLRDGEINLWDKLSLVHTDSSDESSEDTFGGENLFSEILSSLRLDRDTLSTLLSGTDKLAVDNKRMEIMMKVLDKISTHVKDTLEELDEGEGGWIERWMVTRMRAALEASLETIDSIKSTIEDAEFELLSSDDKTEGINDEESEAVLKTRRTQVRHKRSTVTFHGDLRLSDGWNIESEGQLVWKNYRHGGKL